MAINPDKLQRSPCDQLCATVRVERRADGELMRATDFEFPDGDRDPIYLSEAGFGDPFEDKMRRLARELREHENP